MEHCGRRAHDQFGSTRNASSGNAPNLYTSATRQQRPTTYLISITTYCKTISGRTVSTNRHLHACRKTAPLLRRRIYSLGADQRLRTVEDGLPTWGYLAARDLALSWHLVGTPLETARFKCCYLGNDTAIWIRPLFAFWGTPQIWSFGRVLVKLVHFCDHQGRKRCRVSTTRAG